MPDVVEGLKWGFPHFDYKGIFCSMAAFKAHAGFGFWKHQILVDRGIIDRDDMALGQFGRITALDDSTEGKDARVHCQASREAE